MPQARMNLRRWRLIRGPWATSRLAVRLRNADFFPNALVFFPVVERFAVDFVNGSLCDGQLTGLYDQKEIDVVDFSVGPFHINTGEIFITAKTREPVVMNFDQVQREIFTLVWHMKLLVGGFHGVAADESLKSV